MEYVLGGPAFEPELSIDETLKDIIRLNLRLDVCSDKADRAGSWLRAVTTWSVGRNMVNGAQPHAALSLLAKSAGSQA